MSASKKYLIEHVIEFLLDEEAHFSWFETHRFDEEPATGIVKPCFWSLTKGGEGEGTTARCYAVRLRSKPRGLPPVSPGGRRIKKHVA